MFRSIMVPLDGSVFSELALPIAVRLARSASARLRLVTVCEPTMALAAVADIPTPFLAEDLDVRVQAQTYLAETAHRIGPVKGVDVAYQVLDGAAGPVVAQAIEEAAPDLVVMTTHGRGSLSRFWLGSVTDHVVRQVHVPVLLIKPEDGSAVPALPLPLHSILVPLDLSEPSSAILPAVKALACLTQGHVTLFHVVDPAISPVDAIGNPFPHVTELVPELVEDRRARAQKALDAIADELRECGHGVSAMVVVRSGAARAILDQATRGKFDLVALTTHGAGGVRRLLLGSVADKVIRGSPKPVLVLRPPEQ